MGSIIRIAAVVISGFVLVGFAFFAVDELDRSSKTQQRELANELQGVPEDSAPTQSMARDEAAREAAHSGPREMLDDVNDLLLAPFVDLVDSEDAWVARGVPTILALLLYGLGFGFLANLLPKPQARGQDWRDARF